MTSVRGNRWAEAGTYLYEVRFTAKNDSDKPASYSLLDFTVLGPAGETFPGYTSSDVGREVSVLPRSVSANSILINGNDAGHLYAERVRVRMSYRAEGRRRGVLTDENAVDHPPQSARLLDFSMSPPGAEPGAATPAPPVMLGQQVTVRWNVEGASVVVLESSLGMTPTNTGLFKEQVEPVGSRTFTTQREGVAFATLDIDQRRIYKSLHINVRR